MGMEELESAFLPQLPSKLENFLKNRITLLKALLYLDQGLMELQQLFN